MNGVFQEMALSRLEWIADLLIVMTVIIDLDLHAYEWRVL